MTSLPVYVGLDYHQDSIQVCVLNAEGSILTNRSCANRSEAVVALVEQHGQVRGLAIESCSGAADLADELVRRTAWTVHLAHPGFVSRMKQNPDKTDYGDARMLADLERVGYLPRVWLAPLDVRELRRLSRYRFQKSHQRRDCKLRIRAILRDQRVRCGVYSPWSQAWLGWLRATTEVTEQTRWIIDQELEEIERLSQQIKSVEKRLEQLTCNDPLVQSLLQERGIGPVTAWVIRAEIGRFDRFRTGKQLSRYCGLSPRNASSGSRQADAGLVRAGNSHLRFVLVEAAHRLIRLDPRWHDFAVSLAQRGKPKCVIIAATANRWVRGLFHRQLRPSSVSLPSASSSLPAA